MSLILSSSFRFWSLLTNSNPYLLNSYFAFNLNCYRYNCISEQFGDSLNICHLPMYQDQKYKFKVDWIKGQKEKLPNSKTPSGKSSSEGSVNMFQTNDDFDFVSFLFIQLLFPFFGQEVL